MRKTLSVALAAVAVGVLVPGMTAAAPAPPQRSSLSWRACPQGIAHPGVDCSTLQVPLDYRHPDGRKITIAFSRLSSAEPAQRRGVLLINPGGPGLSGMASVTLLGLPESVRNHYDIIGLDPRGVGRSTPVTCDMTTDQRRAGLNSPYPRDAAAVTAQAGAARTLATQCATSETAALLPHITTANTARDMDRLRIALGVPKISYYGLSYGTYLGAVYTTMFPRHSDRVVLDSSLGPGGYDIDAARGFGPGFADRFPAFARYAAAHPEHGLGSTPAAVTAKYYELAARLDDAPLPGNDGTWFRATTFGLMYDSSQFGALAEIWHSLDTGQPIPTGPVAASDNTFASHFHVICNDSRWPRSVRTYQRNVLLDRIRYPMYGAMAANIRPCAFWPAPVEQQVRITGRGPSNVLMAQNLHDPGTPLPGARRLRAAFGDRARMVTVDQGGHGVYLAANTCGKDAMTDFLVTGRRPARNAFCPAQP